MKTEYLWYALVFFAGIAFYFLVISRFVHCGKANKGKAARPFAQPLSLVAAGARRHIVSGVLLRPRVCAVPKREVRI